MPNSGVYAIRHDATGQQYIGGSRNIAKRFRQHKNALVKNKHYSVYLQAAWNTHGADAFSFVPLLFCDVANLRSYEQICLDGLNSSLSVSRKASGVDLRGTSLYPAWRNNVAASIQARYADGFKVVHPPRTAEYRVQTSVASKARWADPVAAAVNTAAIQASMTAEECAKRSERTASLWKDPEYRAKAVAARKGNAYSLGYKCTPEQVENRRRAARITHTKRAHGADWRKAYVLRYPEHAGDVDAI